MGGVRFLKGTNSFKKKNNPGISWPWGRKLGHQAAGPEAGPPSRGPPWRSGKGMVMAMPSGADNWLGPWAAAGKQPNLRKLAKASLPPWWICAGWN